MAEDTPNVKLKRINVNDVIYRIEDEVATEEIAALKNTTTNLSGQVNTVTSGLAEVESFIATLDSQVDQHTTQIGNLNTTVGQLSSTVSELQTTVAGKKAQLLWENSSPNSAFAAQTLSVSTVSDYDFYLVEIKYNTGSAASRVAHWVIGESKTRVSVVSGDDAQHVGRDFTFDKVSGTVDISTGYTSSSTQSTSRAVPTKIYGVKF